MTASLDRKLRHQISLLWLPSFGKETAVIEFETLADRDAHPEADDLHPDAKRRATLIAKGDFRDPEDAILDDDEARKDLQKRVIGRTG